MQAATTATATGGRGYHGTRKEEEEGEEEGEEENEGAALSRRAMTAEAENA